jgi:hypothetical protein
MDHATHRTLAIPRVSTIYLSVRLPLIERVASSVFTVFGLYRSGALVSCCNSIHIHAVMTKSHTI